MLQNDSNTIVGYILGSKRKDWISLLVPVSLEGIISFCDGAAFDLHFPPTSIIHKMVCPDLALTEAEKFIIDNICSAKALQCIPKKYRIDVLHGKVLKRKTCLTLRRFYICNGYKDCLNYRLHDDDFSLNTRIDSKVLTERHKVCNGVGSAVCAHLPLFSIVSKPRPRWVYSKKILVTNTTILNRKRSRALESLIDACTTFRFIVDVDYNVLSLALHLERACWINLRRSNLKYREKVLNICAAMLGLYRFGTLSYAIAHGLFSTPSEVIGLPYCVLERCQKSEPLS